MSTAHIEIPKDRITEFCKRKHIRKLSLFGSALHGNFRPHSDIDLLVEFDPDHIPVFLKLAHYELTLKNHGKMIHVPYKKINPT